MLFDLVPNELRNQLRWMDYQLSWGYGFTSKPEWSSSIHTRMGCMDNRRASIKMYNNSGWLPEYYRWKILNWINYHNILIGIRRYHIYINSFGNYTIDLYSIIFIEITINQKNQVSIWNWKKWNGNHCTGVGLNGIFLFEALNELYKIIPLVMTVRAKMVDYFHFIVPSIYVRLKISPEFKEDML